MTRQCSEAEQSLAVEGNDGLDYVLRGDYCWITVKNLAIQIQQTDEGVIVDVYPHKNEMADNLATLGVCFDEANNLCDQCGEVFVNDSDEETCPSCRDQDHRSSPDSLSPGDATGTERGGDLKEAPGRDPGDRR